MGIISDFWGRLATTPPPDALPLDGLSYQSGDPAVTIPPGGGDCPTGYGTLYAYDGSKQCLTEDQIVAAGPGIADQIQKGTQPPLSQRVLLGGVDAVNQTRDAIAGALPNNPFGWGNTLTLVLIGAGILGAAYVVRSFR